MNYKLFKRKINDFFFNFTMLFGIKLFSAKKAKGYYSNFHNILKGLKENGYYKIENFYDQNAIKDLNKHSYAILDSVDKITADNVVNVETKEGEIKIKNVDIFSNILKAYTHEFIFILISIFFYGRPRLPVVKFHLVHDGSFQHNKVPGKSKKRISGYFHVDSLEKHVLKAIIFLDDVTPETGGETIMIPNSYKKLRYFVNHEKYEKAKDTPNQFFKDDIEIENELKEAKILSEPNTKHLYGNKGDVILIDSCNAHKGNILKAGQRAVLWLDF
jgi:ectoine hydroxylase-related dioxygenase (phytanoyl-CoA dioxygenase family)